LSSEKCRGAIRAEPWNCGTAQKNVSGSEFPFTDQISTKRRPAVVVSSADYHRERGEVILMAVTSQIKSTMAFGEITIGNWRQAGLVKPSMIKPVLTTIEEKLILKQLGSLGEDDQKALRDCLSIILTLPRL